MDKLIRDPSKVISHLKESDDGVVYTDVPMKLHIPERYLTRKLAVIGLETYILSFFALIVDDKYYSVDYTPVMIQIDPASNTRVMIDDVSYVEFHFDANSVVFKNTDVVQDDKLAFYIYSEHIDKGHIPWYFGLEEHAMMLTDCSKWAGINLGDRSSLDLIKMTMVRDSQDYGKFYRHILQSLNDLETNPPTFIPFRSVTWNTTDTTSKLNGAYFSDGVTTALVNPSEHVEHMERLLRT